MYYLLTESARIPYVGDIIIMYNLSFVEYVMMCHLGGSYFGDEAAKFSIC